MARLRQGAARVAVGVPLAATLYGAMSFLLEFPEPLPSFLLAANSSEGVRQLLGTPLTRSLFWNGKASSSQAVVSIPVRGSHASGILRGRAVRPPGQGGRSPAWQVITLDVERSEDGKLVDVLAETAPPPIVENKSPAAIAMAEAMAALHSGSRVDRSSPKSTQQSGESV